MDALLLYLTDLTLKSGLCLLVLFGPPILICVTAYKIHTKQTRYTGGQLVICNVLVGVAVAVVAVFSPLSTLRTHAIAAYIVVVVLLMIFGLLVFVYRTLSLGITLMLGIRRRWALRRTNHYGVIDQDINASRVRL